MSFLFVFQNDNDLIDNDNAGQSPAAQAVVLTFSLTYYLILTLFRFSFGCTICVRILTPHSSVLHTYCNSFSDLFTYLYSNIFVKITYYYLNKKANLLQHIIYFFCKITLFIVQFFYFTFHIIQEHTRSMQKKCIAHMQSVSYIVSFMSYIFF